MHATCSPICPEPTATTAALTVYELRSSLRTLVRNQRRDTAMECLSDACGRKNRQRQLHHAGRRVKGAVMSLVGTYWRRCLGERPLRAGNGRSVLRQRYNPTQSFEVH